MDKDKEEDLPHEVDQSKAEEEEDDDPEEIYPEDQEEDEEDIEDQPEQEEPDPIPVKPIQPKRPLINRNIEIVKFLKEYSFDVARDYTSVAKMLRIKSTDAEQYVKKYIYLMVNTRREKDYPRKVREILNRDVPVQYQITNDELLKLKTLIEKYGEYEVLDEAPKATSKEGVINTESNIYNNKELFTPPFDPNRKFDPTAPPTGSYEPYQRASEPVYDKPYENAPPSPRADLLEWVLYRTPFIQYVKIRPFIELFKADERRLMEDPVGFYSTITKYFGEQPGDIAFNRFRNMLSHLPPGSGFGFNPWYQTQGSNIMGAAQSNGFNPPNQQAPMQMQSNYYQAMGIVPPGIDPSSPTAVRFIEEYERKKRADEEEERLNRKITHMVNLRMMDAMDPKKQQQDSNMPNMNMMFQSGMVRMIPIKNQDGSTTWAYEPRSPMDSVMQMQNMNQTNQNSSLEWTKLIMDTYKSVFEAQNQTPKFMESLLNTLLNKFNQTSDPFTAAINAKKLADTINPPQNQNVNFQVADLALKQKRLDLDEKITTMTLEHNWNKEKWEREQSLRQEAEASKNTSELVKSVFSIGKELLPYITMFMQGKQAGGMQGGLGGMLRGMANPQQGMQGFQEMPPMQQEGQLIMPNANRGRRGVRVSESPNWSEIERSQAATAAEEDNRRFYAPPSDLYGYTRPQQQPQQPVQQQQQPQQQEIPDTQTYTPEIFEGYSLEELERYRYQGMNSNQSIQSFNHAVSEAIRRKKLLDQQAQQQPPPQQLRTDIPVQNQYLNQPKQRAVEYEPTEEETTILNQEEVQAQAESTEELQPEFPVNEDSAGFEVAETEEETAEVEKKDEDNSGDII